MINTLKIEENNIKKKHNQTSSFPKKSLYEHIFTSLKLHFIILFEHFLYLFH